MSGILQTIPAANTIVVTSGNQIIAGNKTFTGVIESTDTTTAANTSSGSLRLPGIGMGNGVIFTSGAATFGGNVTVATDSTLSLSTTNPNSIVTLTRGGVSYGFSVAGNNLVFRSSTVNYLSLVTGSTASQPIVALGTTDATNITNCIFRSSFFVNSTSFTNQTGANLTLSSGNGTGTGTLPFIDFQTPDLQASGTSLQTYTSKARLTGVGNLLIGTTTDNATDRLQVNGSVRASQFNLSALSTAPASATAPGATGERRNDGTYDYICIATNTWRRSAAYTTW